MTDFSKILDKAKELEAKVKESQENIKKIRAEGVSGSNSVTACLCLIISSNFACNNCCCLNYVGLIFCKSPLLLHIIQHSEKPAKHFQVL